MMLQSKSEIAKWLDKYNIKNYTINDDLTVDVAGHVFLDNKGLATIPIQFGQVGGNFWCNNNKLKSLEGCPNVIRGGFYCADKFKNDIEYLRWLFSKKVMAL